MSYLQVIFLYILKKFNGNRSVYGAYHILKGKKTAQTVQDCRLFQVAKLFGVYKSLDRITVLEVVKWLLENNYLKVCGEHRYLLTSEGELFLAERLKAQPLPMYLNGFVYKDTTDIFWARLALLTQCLSHLKIGKSQFIPIIKDVRTQALVKARLQNSSSNFEELAKQLYVELRELLQQFSTQEASTLVLRLSSVQRVGLTIDQVSQELQLDIAYTNLLFVSAIHGLIAKATEHQEDFVLIFSLVEKIETRNLLTETSQKTYTLLQKGLDIAEISRIRSLKRNTIEDHIVEIALNNDEFSIDPFLSHEKQQAIISVIADLKTKRLKEIKDELNETISYFDIRLILAKKGFLHGD